MTDTSRPSLYSLLDRDAKSWWYHKLLRERGQGGEARIRERRSIVGNAKFLRELRDQKLGVTYYPGSAQYVSDTIRTETGSHHLEFGGYRHGSYLVEACKLLGIPVRGEEES